MVGFRKQTSQRLNQLDDIIETLSTRVQILEDERAATAQTLNDIVERTDALDARITATSTELARQLDELGTELSAVTDQEPCLLYTSPSPRDRTRSRMPSSA